MLEIQSKYISFIKEVQEFIKDIENMDKTKQNKLIVDISHQELCVVVVGGFSAGKSTLINQFLGEDILATALTPETALATELRFHNENFYEAIKSDGSSQRFELSQSEEIKQQAGKFAYLKLFLNNEKLKQIEPLILVDMPGFGAPVEEHNQAIINYLSKGVYFIVLTSVEDGNITKSMLREVENIINFGKDFSFVLSKTNLRSNEDVRAVKDEIQSQLQEEFNYTRGVISVDKNSAESFEKILMDINPNQLFQKIYEAYLKEFYFDISSNLKLKIATLKSSKEEIQKVLEDLQKGVNDVRDLKEKVISDVEDKFSHSSTESIVNAVGNELMLRKKELVSLMGDRESFNSEVNSIVKNVLIIEVNRKLKRVNEYITYRFDSKIKDIAASFNPEFQKGFTDVLATTTNMISDEMTKHLPQWKEGGHMAIIAVLVLKILDAACQFLKSERIERLKEDKIVNEVVPSVKAQLRNKLPAKLQEYIEQTTQNAAAKFEELIKQKEAEVAQSAKEKEENKKELEVEISKLSRANAAISELANQLF
ncbi:hypothetical protein LS71_007880 [Helicobacter jaachi]|uniref:Dynamin N-terminal domain-containing protein n=1 Tax=Helicobacter jaachi TaxID=1677920 RepID=A0A4V6I2E6_9HELI|nr:dynamin family protein [Helicobacter jaachi]TLD95752.1 hypothetical protein LS71_007880 [Helicobacter jaachi]